MQTFITNIINTQVTRKYLHFTVTISAKLNFGEAYVGFGFGTMLDKFQEAKKSTYLNLN